MELLNIATPIPCNGLRKCTNKSISMLFILSFYNYDVLANLLIFLRLAVFIVRVSKTKKHGQSVAILGGYICKYFLFHLM